MKRKGKQSLGDAVVAGSAIAGVALGAAAVFLSDKKNQKKIKKTIDEVSEEAIKIGEKVKKKVTEFTGTKETAKPKAKKKTTSSPPKTSTKIYTPKNK